MAMRRVLLVALVVAFSLYADSVPVVGCAGSPWVHHLCTISGATPVNPFDPPISGDLNNLPSGQPYVFIEGPWLGHRITNYGALSADWVAGAQQTGAQYSQVNGPSGNVLFPNTANSVPVGLELYSYYVREIASGSGSVNGTLTFDFPIVAVFATNRYGSYFNRLTASDASFGAENSSGGLLQSYLPGYGHAVSLDSDPNDWIMVHQGGYALTFNFNFGSAGAIDSIRILTATPEPAAVVVFGTVAAALFAAKRLRKRRGA